jgi:glycosyltransferase involved in cell wall biosynthesis
LGRICELKGHYFVIEAARRLKTQGSSEFRFRFIGEAATPAESSAARRLVRDSGLADWIEFRGYRADIGEELARIDALAIPSVGEAFGRILCEAAEADVPVVLGDSGGLGELSRRFDIGLRFPPRDLNGFLGVLGRVRAEYGRVAAEFRVAAKRLLDALDLHAYSRVMEGVFVQVAARRPVSVVWTGEEKEQGPCASST